MRSVAIALVLFACGPRTDGTTPDPPVAVDASPVDDAVAASSTTDAAPPVDPRARCETLVDHLAAVALAEAPADKRADAEAAVARERPRLVEACLATPPSDAEYACAMTATTHAAVDQCR